MAAQYQVSARKYRPQNFDSVVGQSHITTTLKNAIRREQLAHAYLFCGPRGVGKTSCARILAKTINCTSPREDMEACGQCTHCQHFSTSSSFNIFELDAASNNSVEDIRNLTEQVQYSPQQGRYKVYIIDEVHMLSSAAFNAFLKTLEEPPSYAIFILATTEKHKILPTILSRCQIFDFKRIPTDDIVAHLQEVASLEGAVAQEGGLHVIAQKSEGCMRDALSMFDRIMSFTGGALTYQNTMEHLNLLDADFYFQLTDSLLAKDLSQTLIQLNDVMDKGFEGEVILDGLAGHFRNMLMAKEAGMARLLEVPRELKAVYFDKAGQIPPSFLISSLSLLHEALMNYRTAPQRKLHVEVTLLRLCYILEATQEKKKRLEKPTSLKAADKQMPPPVSAPVSIPVENEKQRPQKDTQDQVLNSGPRTGTPSQVQSPSGEKNSPPAPTPVARTSKMVGTGRRISKELMHWDSEDMTIQPQNEVMDLDQEQIQGLFQKFVDTQIPEKHTSALAQFSEMKVVFSPPDEVRIICSNLYTEKWAQDFRDKLIAYFRNETRSPLRMVTEIQEPEPGQEAEPEVMNQQDLFALFKQKNPLLGELYTRLGLRLEH